MKTTTPLLSHGSDLHPIRDHDVRRRRIENVGGAILQAFSESTRAALQFLFVLPDRREAR